MYYINSNRLRLVPLSFDQLVLLIENRNELEMELGLQLSDFKLYADDSFLAAFSQVTWDQMLPLMKEHADEMEWYTHWMIIEKEHNITVGGMGMNGPPDKHGQVMIGYFTDNKFESRGYATEIEPLVGNQAWERRIIFILLLLQKVSTPIPCK